MGKFREFKAVTYIEYDVSTDGKSSWALKLKEGKDPQKDGKHLIEKAAFTEAVELIDETQKAIQSFKEQTEKHGGDYLPAHAIWFNECLAKIKEFKGEN